MDIHFESVYDENGIPTALALAGLYADLEQRTPDQNISHQTMPTWEQHVNFVRCRPYVHWLLIYDRESVRYEEEPGEPSLEYARLGSIYLTKAREIGLFIDPKRHREGYGREALTKFMEHIQPRGPFFANISPKNIKSQKFFEGMGFQLVQFTYRFDPVFFDEPLYAGHPAAAARPCMKAVGAGPNPEYENKDDPDYKAMVMENEKPAELGDNHTEPVPMKEVIKILKQGLFKDYKPELSAEEIKAAEDFAERVKNKLD